MAKNLQTIQLDFLKKYRKENPYALDDAGFNKILFDIMAPGKDIVYDEYLDFLLWCNKKPGRQENFLAFLKTTIFPQCPGLKKIMEIGCGKYARLAMQLANNNYYVTCVDPALDKAFQIHPNIKTYTLYFDYRNEVCLQLASKNDLVIAQEPCDAAEHIIRTCELTQTPYFVILCAVPHMRSDNIMPKTAFDWYNYLQSHAPHGILQKTNICGINYYVMYCIDFKARTVII